MKQYEAVIKVMEDNGGYATLGYLYEHVSDVPDVTWKTKTPFASIRRIVQDGRFFFKIKPGLWALKKYKKNLPLEIARIIDEDKSGKLKKPFTHSYYQGMLVEIGTMKGFYTYVPIHDHDRKYLNRSLIDLINRTAVPGFTYEEILRRIKSIDVMWINERNFPSHVFEVEHTTDFKSSLLKFLELQDFNINMNIVSSSAREKEFYNKINFTGFQPIKNRVNFLNYEKISRWYYKSYELMMAEKNLVN